MSDAALAVFRRFLECNGDFPVDDANREAYRELAREGLMRPGHSFKSGWSFYVLTEAGRKFAAVLERGTFARAEADA